MTVPTNEENHRYSTINFILLGFTLLHCYKNKQVRLVMVSPLRYKTKCQQAQQLTSADSGGIKQIVKKCKCLREQKLGGEKQLFEQQTNCPVSSRPSYIKFGQFWAW